MATTERLTLRQFRRRVVAGAFPQFSQLPAALLAMKFVQADPIRAPARAQDLTLRQRVRGYSAGHLESVFQDLDAEEGYLFAYGFMTPDVWQNLRWRPSRRLKKQERDVLEAVAELGEVHPRGLDERFGRRTVKNAWGGQSQETKRILERLHHHGHLRVCRRENGIRVYQVPEQTAAETASPQDRYRHLLLATANVFGATTDRFLLSELRNHNHLLPLRKERLAAVGSLVSAGELTEVEVEGVTYLWRADDWISEEIPERVRILAPFDPLVRDRARFEQLWHWMYRFEAYLPAARRQRGYYAMPLLWREQVVGWANAKVVDERLIVDVGYAETRPKSRAFRACAESEVEALTRFLGLPTGAWDIAL